MATRQVEQTVTTTVRECDDCLAQGTHPPYNSRVHQCVFCGRDICVMHTSSDPTEGGDHPTRYCWGCWQRGAPYRTAIVRAREGYEQEAERQVTAWRAACQKAEPTSSDGSGSETPDASGSV